MWQPRPSITRAQRSGGSDANAGWAHARTSVKGSFKDALVRWILTRSQLNFGVIRTGRCLLKKFKEAFCFKKFPKKFRHLGMFWSRIIRKARNTYYTLNSKPLKSSARLIVPRLWQISHDITVNCIFGGHYISFFRGTINCHSYKWGGFLLGKCLNRPFVFPGRVALHPVSSRLFKKIPHCSGTLSREINKDQLMSKGDFLLQKHFRWNSCRHKVSSELEIFQSSNRLFPR